VQSNHQVGLLIMLKQKCSVMQADNYNEQGLPLHTNDDTIENGHVEMHIMDRPFIHPSSNFFQTGQCINEL
jgi:hypothetical protein